MSELSTEYWRRCSSCKTTIAYSAKYFVCSVSTCTRKRTGYVFCTVHCWERHLPGARHKDAAAIETKSPTYEQWKAELGDEAVAPGSGTASPQAASSSVAEARSPQRVIVRTTATGTAAPAGVAISRNDPLEQEILVVVSKLKNYIRERSEMSTSDSVTELLSDRLRRLCDKAIDKARAAGRKTVMDRDFE